MWPVNVNIPVLEKKEGNVLFNDARNTFYLQLCAVEYMVNDDSAREETPCRHYMGYVFRLAARELLYSHHSTDRIAHTMAIGTPAVEHWLERTSVLKADIFITEHPDSNS